MAVAVLTAFPAASAGAYSSDDQVMQRLRLAQESYAQAQHREQSLRSDIASADAQRRSLDDDLRRLNAQLAEAQARLDAAQGVLDGIQQQLDAKNGELQSALQDLQDANSMLRRRAVAVYKSGPASLLDFVLGALDFRDLLARLEFVLRVFHSDGRKIDSIRTGRDRITQERDQISSLRQRAADQLAVVQAERDDVASIRNSIAARSSRLAGEVRQKTATLEDVQGDKAALLREIAELQRQSAGIAGFLQGRSKGPASVSPRGMIWPTQGVVSSPFGWRINPVYQTKEFHPGIDIAAPMGQPVVAAAAGQVIFVGPRGGYGNVVIVDHGGGVATVYAHLSAFATSVGARLPRGRMLGRVGCTGLCTGPHLHFEVRVDGVPQDPMRWLP